MDKFIEEEIRRFHSVASQLFFEGVSLEKILNTLIKHLIIRLNERGNNGQTELLIPNDNKFKLLICRATTCKHNIEHKCLCGLDFGLEINKDGSCLHYDKSIIRNPITGSIWQK